jgi:isopentenyl-diphosphate delta-isomerase
MFSMTQVVLVDRCDKVLGLKEKFATHKVPVPLHRAISIVIYNKDKNQMLITKRSIYKPTWPYFWSNAVCSHPYPNETYPKAAERRLFEELGFKTALRKAFKLTYEAKMDNGIWGECELDNIFIGKYEGKITPNPQEVAGYEWIGVRELKKDLKANPKKYTPWFKLILKKLNNS